MKIQPECIPCLLKRILFESELSTKDENIRNKIMKDTCALLAELYDSKVASCKIATKIHKLAYDILDDKDPYKELKIKANKAAETLIPRVEELIDISDDRLRMAMLCSIIGNMMDFGIDGASSHPDKLSDIFEKTLSEDLGYDDYDKVKEILKNSKNVMLFIDNCGEIVFDKILCRELKKLNPHIILSVIFRGEPILSDATMEDAMEYNFEEVADEILTTGCFTVGVDFEKLPEKVSKRLDESDIIIAKGMGNYETFSEKDFKPIVYLMRTKCSAIAKSAGVVQNINVIKLYV